MDLFGGHYLTVLTFLPLVGALMLLFFPRDEHGQIRTVAFITSLVGFGLSIPLLWAYQPTKGGLQLQESAAWAPLTDEPGRSRPMTVSHELTRSFRSWRSALRIRGRSASGSHRSAASPRAGP